jgi:hypothetical protein
MTVSILFRFRVGLSGPFFAAFEVVLAALPVADDPYIARAKTKSNE